MSPTYQATPLHVDQGTFPMGQNDDRAVPIDLTRQLASGETVTNPTSRLWLLNATTGARESEFAAGLVGGPTVNGNVVSQRVAGLAYGRAYELAITHGAAGNRRTTGVTIPVVL